MFIILIIVYIVNITIFDGSSPLNTTKMYKFREVPTITYGGKYLPFRYSIYILENHPKKLKNLVGRRQQVGGKIGFK